MRGIRIRRRIMDINSKTVLKVVGGLCIIASAALLVMKFILGTKIRTDALIIILIILVMILMLGYVIK